MQKNLIFTIVTMFIFSIIFSPVYDFSDAVNSIDDGAPIFAGCINSSGLSGHAVTIRGYQWFSGNTSTIGTISYMNPDTGNYEASAVGNDYKLELYNSSDGSYYGDMESFIEVRN